MAQSSDSPISPPSEQTVAIETYKLYRRYLEHEDD